jgi:hypothetical protein
MNSSPERRTQKKKSRIKNDITTIQVTKTLKSRLISIQKKLGLDKQDDALDEIITQYEDRQKELAAGEINNEE